MEVFSLLLLMCDVVAMALVTLVGIVDRVIRYFTDPCRPEPPTPKPPKELKNIVENFECTCRFLTCIRPKGVD